jgi:hypothetical protein
MGFSFSWMVPENFSWREVFVDTIPLAKGTNFAISSQCATRVFSTQSANKSIVFLYENELNVSGMSSSVTSNLVNCTVERLACQEPKEISIVRILTLSLRPLPASA